MPYVEVPAQSAVFDYQAAGLGMGSVAVIVYNGRLAYGVVGHEQDADVIGAASYALAAALGVNPDPVNGGLQIEDVTYFAFTGPSNVVPAFEDTTAAAALAKAAAQALIAAGLVVVSHEQQSSGLARLCLISPLGGDMAQPENPRGVQRFTLPQASCKRAANDDPACEAR